MYFPKISNVNGMTERRWMETISRNPVFQSVKIYFPQKKNIPIGGIKDIDCNTKSNLLIIEFPISGLGEPEI